MSTPERGRVPASMLLRSNRTDDLSVDLKKSKQPPPLRRTDLHTKSPTRATGPPRSPPSAPGLRDGALGPGFRGRRVSPRECKLASLACPRHRWNPNAPLRHPDARWPSPHRTPQPGALGGRRPGKEGAESELSHLLKRFLTRSVRDRGARAGMARSAPPASGREAEGRAETWTVFHS